MWKKKIDGRRRSKIVRGKKNKDAEEEEIDGDK